MVSSAPIRMGILGAANIAPGALIGPARRTDGVEVTAIAARDRRRAETFARRHGIATVRDSYDALVEDPDIDAVYIPLPNGLHGTWTKRAIQAGKHVLCEKPFAANADEAADVRRVVDATDRVVMEAFHWRYHPLNVRLLRRIERGDLGELTAVDAAFCFPLPRPSDIRWSRALAGGSLMDAGCYPVHQVRSVLKAAGAGEPGVTGAKAAFTAGGVDRALRGALSAAGNVTATIRCGLFNLTRPVAIHLEITGTAGSALIRNPVLPQLGGHCVTRIDGHRHVDWAERTPSYDFQLEAFRDAVHTGASFPTTVADAVANMVVIDDLYRAAGITPHSPTRVDS